MRFLPESVGGQRRGPDSADTGHRIIADHIATSDVQFGFGPSSFSVGGVYG